MVKYWGIRMNINDILKNNNLFKDLANFNVAELDTKHVYLIELSRELPREQMQDISVKLRKCLAELDIKCFILPNDVISKIAELSTDSNE